MSFREYQKEWVRLHPGKSAEYSRRHRLKHLKKRLAASRAYAKTPAQKASVMRWRKRNSEKHRAYQRRWWSESPEHRLRCGLASRIRQAVKRDSSPKAAKTLELVGCSVRELRAHLEKHFRPGMTWENYGPVWHIDHRKPCAKFDLSDPAQQRECFHYTNLQPLFAEENLKKGAK